MSDEERGTGDGAGDAAADEDFSAITDPALAGRLETIHRSMSTMGTRIDALVTSTTSYRAALTDRLTEYAGLVTELTRAQASDLDEYRRANERTLGDLRRALSTSEETLERVGARIDSMLTDAESSDDSSRRALAEVRSILEAQENLGRFLTESLDQFGEQVMARLAASEQAATDQLAALRSAVADVDATPDPALAVVGDRLAGIEDRLAVVAGNDTAAALGARFDTLHATLEELDRNLRADLETTANGSSAAASVLEQLKETLQDLASGEVVGALWDEVRQVRATIEALVDRDEQTVDPGSIESLRTDVTDLNTAVRDLLEQAEVVDDAGAAPTDGGPLVALAADVRALRDELSQGLVVEPSDVFGSSIEQLRTDLAALQTTDAAAVEATLPEGLVDELRSAVEQLQAATTQDDPAGAQRSEEVEAELRAVRAGVEDIIERLDAGLELAADDLDDPDGAPTGVGAPELVDQIATLRDQVSVEFERVRQLLDSGDGGVDLTPLTARLDRLHDDLAELEPAPAGAPSAAGEAAYATVDPDVIDLLREEIRTAGSVPDELIETLSNELKALRRRIRLRAEGEIFSDEQLEVIAAAVADKLGK